MPKKRFISREKRKENIDELRLVYKIVMRTDNDTNGEAKALALLSGKIDQRRIVKQAKSKNVLLLKVFKK